MDTQNYWAISTTGERLGPMTLEQLVSLHPQSDGRLSGRGAAAALCRGGSSGATGGGLLSGAGAPDYAI